MLQNSPNLKRFELQNYTSSTNHLWPSCIASFCPYLEYLILDGDTETDKCFEVLSTRCHKLKSLELYGVSYLCLDKFLKVNNNLLFVDIDLCTCCTEDQTFIGDIFEILGQYCPLLQKCQLKNFKIHATDIQINTFTKGCR